MNRLQEFAHRLQRLAPALFAALVAVYIGYHASGNPRGILSWQELDRKIETKRGTLAAAEAEHRALAHRVRALRPGQVDLDLLDEQARLLLNLGKAGEIVIFRRGAGAGLPPR